RVDGSYNKVGWVGKGDYSTGNTDIAIETRPFGESQPVLTSPGDANASFVDLPKPGCWTFRLSWSAHGQQQVSTINLEVLPAGARPVGIVPARSVSLGAAFEGAVLLGSQC